MLASIGACTSADPAPEAPGAPGAPGAPESPEAVAAAEEAAPATDEGEPAEALAGEPAVVDDFTLLDQLGRSHELYLQDDARAVVLISYSVGCPILRWSLPRVEEMAERYGDRVRFFYVDAAPHDTRTDLVQEAEDFDLSVPILMDESQVVLKSLGVRRTADAFLIDTRDWSIVYRGKIDDRATYGGQSGGTKRDYLDEAIGAFLEGQPPPVPRTRAEGCLIYFGEADSGEPPKFVADVAPILLEHCTGCHTSGGVAPWSMSSFERVRGWSPMIRETVLTRRMPPWHADPHVGRFANDRSLSNDELRTLVRWIDAGTPRGEGGDPLASRIEEGAPEWPLGEPDLVFRGSEQSIPATGIVPYHYEWIPFEVEEDLWVRGVHLKPSNYRVLHHSLVLVVYPEHLKHLEPEYLDGVGSYFALYIPNMRPRMFPEDAGKLVPKGSRILLQSHYTTTGRPETDHPTLALYLHDEPPAVEFGSTSAVLWEIDIPPGDPHHELTATKVFEEDVRLYDLIPHMHYRARQARFRARYPDGREELLLSVPNYDFNWQTSYQLAEPLEIPAGTVIECTAVFDNSAQNPFNPNPNARVRWGPKSADEMLTGYMNYAVDRL